LSLEYRSIQHHIEVLKKNQLVTSQGERYGLTYFLSPWLESNIQAFHEISRKLHLNLEPVSHKEEKSGTDL